MRPGLSFYAMVAAMVLFGGAVTFTLLRGEDTRDDVSVIKRTTVDPCRHPKSESCQRRIRLVLRELVRRHPHVLDELGLEVRRNSTETGVSGGGGADNTPSGGGPVGRVPPPRAPAPRPPSAPTPEPPAPKPLLDLDAPVPAGVCTDLVRVNC